MNQVNVGPAILIAIGFDGKWDRYDGFSDHFYSII